MISPILRTKLIIPPVRPDLVSRVRLHEVLNESLKSRLILVSAPAGFGKSTILSSWLRKSDRVSCWISLDEEDNSPVQFLTYLITALQNNSPSFCDSILASLRSPRPPDPLTVMPYLVEETISLPETVIVLDDYHTLRCREIHDIITYLLKHLPPQIHFVLSTRTDPPLPLARLRGLGQMTELRTADLRFTLEEAEEYFFLKGEMDISSQDVALLNDRTEGWITGLHMAFLTLRGNPEKSLFIRSFSGSNRYILDYLLEEVLRQLPEEIISFLVKTSILRRFSADLCRAVTGMEESLGYLERLDRENVFLISLDDTREWYRYHHLFTDLLKQRLASLDGETVKDLHRRASLWFEDNNLLGLSIDHALFARDWNRAAERISDYMGSLWEHGEQNRLSKWIAAIPESLLLENPDILVHYAFTLCFSGEFAAAERQLQFAEGGKEHITETLMGKAATVRAYYSLYSNRVDLADRFSRSALDLLPGKDHMWRSMAFSIYGDVHAFHGHVPTCVEIWNKALFEADLASSSFFSLLAASKLIVALKRLGCLHKAETTFTEHFSQASKREYPQVAVPGAFYSVWANVLMEWNRLDEAAEYMERGLSLSERQGYAAGIAWSMISLSEACFVRGQLDQAENMLNRLESRIEKEGLPAWTGNWLNAWKIRCHISRGNLEKAEYICADSGISLDGEITYPREVEYLAMGRLLFETGSPQEALSLLERLDDHLIKAGWIDMSLEARLLRALIFEEQGDDKAALGLVSSIMPQAEQEGYLRLFLNEGSKAARLLYKALSAGIARAYTGRVLTAFPVPAGGSSCDDQGKGLVEPLSRREKEVLRQIAAGSSNKEAAMALYISEGTIKNHLKNIFGKLDVGNRTQAVGRARNLGLLD